MYTFWYSAAISYKYCNNSNFVSAQSAINSRASIKNINFFPLIHSKTSWIQQPQMSSIWLSSKNLSARAYKTNFSFSTYFLHKTDLPLPAPPCIEIYRSLSFVIFSRNSFLSISYSPLINPSIFFNPELLSSNAPLNFLILILKFSYSSFNTLYNFFWKLRSFCALVIISFVVIKLSLIVNEILPIWLSPLYSLTLSILLLLSTKNTIFFKSEHFLSFESLIFSNVVFIFVGTSCTVLTCTKSSLFSDIKSTYG